MLEITPPSLTKKDLKILKKRRLDHQSKKIRTRFNVLWLTTISSKASEIALIAGVSIRSVFDYIKMYNEGGLAEVMNINYYSPNSKLEGYSALIRDEFEKKTTRKYQGG